jgi:hypothetical protein
MKSNFSFRSKVRGRVPDKAEWGGLKSITLGQFLDHFYLVSQQDVAAELPAQDIPLLRTDEHLDDQPFFAKYPFMMASKESGWTDVST